MAKVTIKGKKVTGTKKKDKITWVKKSAWKKALTVNAGAGNDTINFSKSTYKNTLNGQGGNDLIKGGKKADKINGGTGKDGRRIQDHPHKHALLLQPGRINASPDHKNQSKNGSRENREVHEGILGGFDLIAKVQEEQADQHQRRDRHPDAQGIAFLHFLSELIPFGVVFFGAYVAQVQLLLHEMLNLTLEKVQIDQGHQSGNSHGGGGHGGQKQGQHRKEHHRQNSGSQKICLLFHRELRVHGAGFAVHYHIGNPVLLAPGQEPYRQQSSIEVLAKGKEGIIQKR